MSIFNMVLAIFFTLGVSIAIINVDGSAIELLYTNNYTYLRVVSNFVYIKLKSQGSAKIALTDTPFPSYYTHSIESPTSIVYQFNLHDSEIDNSKSQFAVNGQVKAEVETPSIFSNSFLYLDKFVEILIYWNSDYLIMSRIGDQFPLFHWKDQSFNLQSIKYIGIHIDSHESHYGILSIENQWVINFSSPSNTSHAFGETITKPTFDDDKVVSTTELPSQERTVAPPQNNPTEFPTSELPTLDKE